MSAVGYVVLWVAVALVVSAALSAAIDSHLRRRELRRYHAVPLHEALGRYSQWIVSQRHAAFFDADVRAAGTRLFQELGRLQPYWFPELADPARDIMRIHAGLLAFMGAQDALRRQDAEAWLESDHDAHFMALWRQHRAATALALAQLEFIAANAPAGHAPARGDTAWG